MQTLNIDMEAALLACHAAHQAPGASARDLLLGASEIGDCARRVVYNRLNKPAPTPASAALMGMGRYLEPQAVDLIRAGAKGWRVYRTCQDPEGQFEARAKDAPLMSHPDGLIVVGEPGAVDAVGVLDIKRSFHHVVKAAQAGDIWSGYIDQIHAQTGTVTEAIELGELPELPMAPSFGALFMIDRDNPLRSHLEVIPADPDTYKVLKARARAILPFAKAGNLPDPEPKRGKCGTCPCKRDCPATTGVDRPVTEGLSMADELEIEALVQKLSPIEAQLDPLEKESKELTAQLKEIVTRSGQTEIQVSGARIKLVPSKTTTLDKKAIEAEIPGLLAQHTHSTPTLTMRVSYF